MKCLSFIAGVAVAFAEVEETTSLLQSNKHKVEKHKEHEIEDCYVNGGCKTTTTTTEAIITETTTSWAEVIVDKPDPDSETDQDKYCGPKAAEFSNENLKTATVNNLGGLGPGGEGTGRWKGWQVIAYECGIVLQDGTCVDVVISTEGNNYFDKHKSRFKKVNGRNGRQFVEKYNGDAREGVIGIGALFQGEYRIKFSFYDVNKNPVVIDYLPLTFYDLDGTDILAGGRIRFEEVLTDDAEGVVVFAHSTLEDVQPIKHNCRQGTCRVQSVTQEVELPQSFDTLTDDEKSAAATFLFAHKSSIQLTYKLNFDHRVMLFKGSKSLYCA